MNNQKQNTRKKKPSWLPFVLIGGFVLFSLLDEIDEDLFILLFVFVFFIIVIVGIAAAASAVKKASAGPAGHSHDRIDHSRDVVINRQTGKVESTPVRSASQHSAREHWKQQLDGLLANGTIDRAEYRALMNRKF